MTLGVAVAAWTNEGERLVLVAADTRISLRADQRFDGGVKTYELGGPCAMVVSGSALPPAMAAELTRSLVENHNRRTPERQISFVNTVKVTSYFLKRAWDEQLPPCRVAVAGFLEAGAPCLADIVVSRELSRAAFRRISRGETTAMPVGNVDGARFAVEAMAAAKRQHRKVVESALNVLRYTARHEGAFRSIGGGLSVGVCKYGSEHFSWPLVEIDGVRFLRGMDVTAAYRPGWPEPEVIRYDEAWCAEQDHRIASQPEQPIPKAGSLPYFDIDALRPEALFTSSPEPPELQDANDVPGPQAT